MRHTCTILEIKECSVTGTVEVIYELDGRIDSRNFQDLASVGAVAGPLESSPQVLDLIIPFWQGQNDPVTGESVPIVGRQIEVDFQAAIPTPQIKFSEP